VGVDSAKAVFRSLTNARNYAPLVFVPFIEELKSQPIA
jgi:hypothetical protein